MEPYIIFSFQAVLCKQQNAERIDMSTLWRYPGKIDPAAIKEGKLFRNNEQGTLCSSFHFLILQQAISDSI